MQLTRLQELLATTEAEHKLEEGKKHYSDFQGMMRVVDDCLDDLKDKLGKGGSLATLFKESGASKLDTHKDDEGKNVLAQVIAKTMEYTKLMSKLMTEAEILISQTGEAVLKEDDLSEAKELSAAEKKTVGWYIVDPDGDNAGYRDSKTGKAKAERECEDSNKGKPRGERSKVVYGYMPAGNGDVKKLPAPMYEDQLNEAADYDDSSEFTEEFYKMEAQITDIKGRMKNPRWMSWMKTTDSNFGTECEAPARAAIQAIGTLQAQMSDLDAEFDKAS